MADLGVVAYVQVIAMTDLGELCTLYRLGSGMMGYLSNFGMGKAWYFKFCMQIDHDK